VQLAVKLPVRWSCRTLSAAECSPPAGIRRRNNEWGRNVLNLPNDLAPLRERPWDVRPNEVRLTIDEVRTALWQASGSIDKAAGMLKVEWTRLNRFIRTTECLHAEWVEIVEQRLDAAERNLWESIHSSERERRDGTAQWVLQRAGREYRPRNSGVPELSNGGLRLVWSDGNRVEE